MISLRFETARIACIAIAANAWIVGLAGGADSAAGSSKLQYNRDVRPILLDNCFSCHGPDSASRQAELRLDRREAAVEKSAIAPGDPEGSEMIRRILSEDPDEQMPPPITKKKLTASQKETLARWIKEGAEYQPHWSFIAPVRSAPPKVVNELWVRNPIDRFILARLEAEKLSPAPEADRRTLARRVCLDLTGLPPTPEVVEEFVNDKSPNAYERLVDRLLESPKWGEHRGRYWLDAARYADTHGIHFDNYREMWSYRDWVIGAFNKNMPFDEFTIENLAGDLLPSATLDQRLGSGFNRCNITTNEGGAIDEEYSVLYTRDRVETTAKVFMGLTAGCAVCHDHKFDPLTQKEFYELAAFFNNTTQAAMDGNVKDTAPIVFVPGENDGERWKALASEIPAVEAQLEKRRSEGKTDFNAWLANAQPEDVSSKIPTNELTFFAPLDDGKNNISYTFKGKVSTTPKQGAIEWRAGKIGKKAAYLNQGASLKLKDVNDLERDQPFSYAAWIMLPANDSAGAVMAKMKETADFRGWDMWVEGRRVGTHIISKWPDSAIKVVTHDQVPANEWVHVAVVYDGKSKAAGVQLFVNGKLQQVDVQADTLGGTIRSNAKFTVGQRSSTSPLTGATIQDLRVYSRELSESEVASLAKVSLAAIVAAPAEKRSESDIQTLYDWWLGSVDPEFASLTKHQKSLVRERKDIQARSTTGYVMQERPDQPMAFVLNRGEYDQRKEQVKPETPAMLPSFPADLPRNRLGLAQWLLRPENPLTARVTVNRFWSDVFGTGIVKTAGDFGVSGELPSHQELLDWLAIEFRDSNWDVKKFFRLIVTSATYRQSAVATGEKLEKDAENRLLSRGPRFRMDGEMVRDYALSASGLLSDKIGGPSVRPYQPPGVWEAVAMIGSNTRDYKQDHGDSLYRRSMYTFWKRAAPPASLDVFNAPSRETCAVTRERTNTPLQALVTLNDPQFVEAARRLAEQALASHDDTDRRIEFLSARLMARPLKPQELAIVRGSLEKFEQHYTKATEDADKLVTVGESKRDDKIPVPQLAAWTMLANELLNLDEVLNK